jgi:hypothetical protein
MDIPDEVMKCVCFVGYRKADGKELLAGTAVFLSRRQILNPDYVFGYVATARHIIDYIKNKGLDKILLRVNQKSGDAVWLDTDVKDWHFHPNGKTADVAVLPFMIPDNLDHFMFNLSGAVNEAAIEKEQIGVGNEIFVTGLFHHHHGKQANIPIVRVGNIAAMPKENVDTDLGPIEAYLVEARSIGGLSGSPVFLPLGTRRTMTGLVMSPGQLQRYYLLGLMHGHFTQKDNLVDELILDGDKEGSMSLNMGIAIVSPIARVVETIRQPELSKIEDEQEQLLKNNTLPTMD